MKALRQRRYGGAEDLLWRDAPIPTPKPDEVLVKVRAASMHADIWHVVTGMPYFLRLMGAGLFGPRWRIPGTDLSGVVEAVGAQVSRFKKGDLVYGECVRSHQWQHGGSFAEYAVAPERKLAPKPPQLGFEAAAALPTSTLIACQTVMDEAQLQAGQSLLINGAAGGVGSMALQIALALGAEVTAVDLPSRLDQLEALGAKRCVDGSKVDFTQQDERYDAIIDIPGNHPIEACYRALKPGGRYVYVGHDGFGATAGPWVGSMRRMLKLFWYQKRHGIPLSFPAAPDYPARFEQLGRWVAEGRLRVSVGRAYPMERGAEALEALVQGKVDGRIVLTAP